MRPKSMPITVTALAFLFCVGLGPAQSPAKGDAETAFNTWLNLINEAPDDAAIETYIREHFAPRLIDAYPMADHVSMFKEIHDDFGELTFHSFREQTDDRIMALLHNDSDQWFQVTLYFDAESGMIRGLGLDDAADSPDMLDAPKATDQDSYGSSILSYAEKKAKADQFSGTVLVILDGKEVCRGAWGEASKSHGVPNRVDTKFNLGSMNKMFTAVSIAQLVEQGKLSFDDTVGVHLPDYANSDVREKVTIHHLLSHTSGMGSHFTEEFINGAKNQYRHFTTYVDLFVDEPLAFEPGERFAYSNAGFFVLGMIVEAASGESYYDYVREHICTPAGMTNTDCYDGDLPVPNLATGYTQQRFDEPEAEDHATWMDEVGPWRSNAYMHSIKGGPAGGGYSTVEDLGRFAKALTDGTLIRPDTLKTMTTPKSPGRDNGYGYGFGTGQLDNSTAYFGHSGGFPGINSVLHILPDRDGFIAVMSNYDGGAMPVASYAERIMPDRK